MKYTTYLFDFDGTLVDSMPTFVSVMLRILDENAISYSDDIVKIITPLGYKGTAEYFINLGLDKSRISNIRKALKRLENFGFVCIIYKYYEGKNFCPICSYISLVTQKIP